MDRHCFDSISEGGDVMASWPYRVKILSGSSPPSTYTYFRNSEAGISWGQITISQASDSATQYLDNSQHPERAKPTVILTPTGEVANVNTFTTSIVWDPTLEQWKWMASSSAFISGSLTINYQALSTWA